MQGQSSPVVLFLRLCLSHRKVVFVCTLAAALFVTIQWAMIPLDVKHYEGARSERFGAVPGHRTEKPNIVFILADDYGWNDIGYHNSFIRTPNLDRLASEGVKLENYYVQPICSPSREQLMTGRYQIHYGLQHSVIMCDRPHGLPLDEVTLPQRLKENGYSTYMVGKWHLGFFRKEYMPLQRGFERFFGYLTGGEDYWTHRKPSQFSKDPSEFHGLDLRDQDKPVLDQNGTYSTHLFARKAIEMILNHDQSKPMFLYLPFQAVHGPLEAPEEYKRIYEDIDNSLVRTYAAMVTVMDEAVGNVTGALKHRGMWRNTILIFSTGEHFLNGSTGETKPLDGFDVWDTISTGAASPRKEILHNIDPLKPSSPLQSSHKLYGDIFNTSVYAALRSGDWKILTGSQDRGGWKHEGPSHNLFDKPNDPPEKSIWLFNIRSDPEEKKDLSDSHPGIVQDMLIKLAEYNKTAVSPFWPPRDLRANPALHGDLWGPWL
ncbi:arylsulfatase J-like [Branchiostoma floridae]|uniref:Arylsulfatase J-like n=1 Tax=Branchiostoma floridae TaxID=7739 RepID=A0A9J7LRF9_BRAFL|nr:arylsulfatase J-like [Branchiostoma floridae]